MKSKVLAYGHILYTPSGRVMAVNGDDMTPQRFTDGETEDITVGEMYEFLRLTHLLRRHMDDSCALVLHADGVSCGATRIRCDDPEKLYSLLDRALHFCGYADI